MIEGEGAHTEERPEGSLTSVEAIQETRDRLFLSREDVVKYVEARLVQACETLYDKNIRTTFSSANKNDIQAGVVRLIIDFDSLSEKNKKIAEKLGEVSQTEGKNFAIFSLSFNPSQPPLTGDISHWANEIADQFQKQPLTWAEGKTLREIMMKFAGAQDERSQKFQDTWGDSTPDSVHEIFINPPYSYFFDPAEGKYYRSEELYKKIHEEIRDEDT